MPAKLVLSLNASVLGEYNLEKERITIGRKPDNDIQIDNLAVSGQHAAIITILNDSFLEDIWTAPMAHLSMASWSKNMPLKTAISLALVSTSSST